MAQPSMNILALNGTTAPMTVLIHDCTKHMEEGGKKDAPYIAELFDVKVLSMTDLFNYLLPYPTVFSHVIQNYHPLLIYLPSLL